MTLLKVLGAFCLYSLCLCDQKLLIDQLRWEFLEMENVIWNFSANGLLYKPQEAAEIYLVKKFNDFDQKLHQIPEDLLYGVTPLRSIPDFLFLYSELKVIEMMYQKFREYQSHHLSGIKEKVATEDIIYDITNNKTGAKKTMERVHEIVYGKEDGILNNAEAMLSDNYWCKNFHQSPQEMFYNLYNLIALNDLKAYALQQFALIGSRLWDKGTFVEDSIATRKHYETTVTNTAKLVPPRQPQDIWRCDPKMFIKGSNYDEFTRLLQGHIQNEVDMSSRRTCRATCTEYSYAKSYGCYDHNSDFCRRAPRCSGNIVECRFVESHASICVSQSPNRRYDYVRYNSGRTFGKDTNSCGYRPPVKSWTRWFVRCHYCMCLCDQEGPLSDRYINLRPVMADVKMNRIVTGIRMVKHNRILHLQIQEGQLLPYGYINQSTVHWVAVDDYKITDSGKVYDKKDFFKMSYGERSMALDQIQVNDDNHIVTGVRFELINSVVHFEIHVSPFNWHTGEVDHKHGYYIYESSANKRTKIQIKSTDIPTETKIPSKMVLTDENAFVEFTHTDFEKDAAQTTIPFIDTQEVINTPAVPLIGAGIYYKGSPGYGGFIATRIKTYDFRQHVSPKMPPMSIRSDDVDNELAVEVN